MSRQLLLCVETNNRARTDYKYIDATIKRFYQDEKKIIYRPIFLGSKTKYNAKDKVREIQSHIKRYPGETTVIYFVDVDDYDVSPSTKRLYDDIYQYCITNDYEFVFFTIDVEDVFLGNKVNDDDKVKKADEFTRKKLIEKVPEKNLRSNERKRHCSNILNVLDQFWNKK
ncbi:MAG: hypothetical protein K6G11_06100 [Lachnospiraceae bacterium]|nr:hypothetical protein [Lachnospiraceae bacterium]